MTVFGYRMAPASGSNGFGNAGTARDVVALLQMASAWLMTTPVSDERLPQLAGWLSRVSLTVSPQRARKGAGIMAHRLGQPTSRDCLPLFAEHHRRRYEHLLGKIRDTHPRGWHPQTALTGTEHVQTAFERGNGVLLWGMSFCGSLVPKMAFHRAGVSVTHLSTPYHGGLSRSWVAINLLNPWHTASENKYLAERVVLSTPSAMTPLKTLDRTLRKNGCVSINGEHPGRQAVAVTCLGTCVAYAVGAPHLARSTGATLLTHYTRRLGPARYQTVIEPPIEVSAGGDRRTAYRDAVHEFAARLERRVRIDPTDWDRWTAEPPEASGY